MRQWLGTELAYAQQHPGDLGERLQTACESAFKAGSEQVVMVGIDCPFITEALLHNTFNALSHYDVVIGPAWDGGYYLLGLNRPTPLYFHNIDWGTDQVYRQTLAKVHLNGDRHFSLPPLPDIDRPPDLAHLSPQFSHWL
jgi:rSAM/selenodomain-associated transferase 1